MCQVSISARLFQIELPTSWRTAFLAILSGCAFLATPPAVLAQDNGWMRALQGDDQKLATIGYRLQVSARDLCSRHRPLIGIAVHDLGQYGKRYRVAAQREFGFEGYPQVLAVAAESPFDAAGIRRDDSIVAIDGRSVPGAAPVARSTADRVATVNRQLDEAAQDGAIVLRLRRQGIDRDIRVIPEQGCGTRFQTAANDTIDAAADGDMVEVDTGAMHFARNDAEIAAIVAHELAHNILRHPERLSAAGVSDIRGARNARLTRQTEDEADRLSVYLMDRAGYPPDAIISFWQRMGAGEGARPKRFRAHGLPAERIAIVATEMAHLAEVKAKGGQARPAFMSHGDLPKLR